MINKNKREDRAVVSIVSKEIFLTSAMKSRARLLLILSLVSCRLLYAVNVTYNSGYLKIVDCASEAPRQAAYIPIGVCIHDSIAVSFKGSNVLQGTDVRTVKYMYVFIVDMTFHIST